MISVYTCVRGVMIPFLFGQEGPETRKHLPCRGTCSSPCPRAAREQESTFLSTVAVGSSTTAHIQRRSFSCLAELSVLAREKVLRAEDLKMKNKGGKLGVT